MRAVLQVMPAADYEQWKKVGSEALTTPPRLRWFSRDHRAVARLYFVLAMIAVVVGQSLSLIMRFHLVKPQAKVGWFESLWPTGAPSGVMTPELYLSIMTLHGTIMIFFVLTTAPMGTFANLVLPEQLGARHMAYPRINAWSFWTIAASFVGLIASFVATRGWTPRRLDCVSAPQRSAPSPARAKDSGKRCGSRALRCSASAHCSARSTSSPP